jgi:raffinose/stachyose/melibiose transport system substrate-binding protein
MTRRFMARKLERGEFRHRKGALLGAALAVGSVSMVATSVPAANASGVPTASINVWWASGGTDLDNLWASMIKNFESSHPGDKINIEYQSVAGEAYRAKFLAGLASSSPPALVISWGGGPLDEYVKAGVVQPFADPGVSDAGNPSWKSNFVPVTLQGVTFGGKIYGMPFEGTQPVFFEYNKTVFKKYGLSFPNTWPELLSDIKTFNSHSVIPIALGNSDNWEGLMYLEYLTDRIGGPQAFLNVEAGDKGAWSEPAIQKALTDIQTLVNDKAFNVGYDSISWTTGAPSALLYSGKAAMQLMGVWDVSTIYSDDASFVKSGGLGLADFPTIPGGTGNVGDLEGNTSVYSILASHLTKAQTYVAEQFMTYFDTKGYAQHLISTATVPTIAGVSPQLKASTLGSYLQPVYQSVEKAPYFQYSWDQYLGPTIAIPMLDNLSKVFELSETPSQFAAVMNKYQAGS